ncbi:MAG: DUF3791 domain-containing protein [Nitrososphaerota archaeon]|jgi:hypothetical protein|nr:DUF3791 domain-containing protein [Nitrososphaerota archaeon]
MKTVADNKTYKTLSYVVLCINKFADTFNLSFIESYRYLENYGGLHFILKHYEIEHTLSIDDAIEDMQAICRKNGGLI